MSLGQYFAFEQVNTELRSLCPSIDQPGKVVEWRGKRYFLAWHTRFGVFVKRLKSVSINHTTFEVNFHREQEKPS